MATVMQSVYRSFVLFIVVCSFGPKLVNAGDEFEIVFRGLAGIGQEIYTTLLDDSSNDLETACVIDRTCHYKHDVVNHWQDAQITEVRLILYKDGAEKVVLTFFNKPTDTSTSWFSDCNLLSAHPWTSLPAQKFNDIQYFSAEGYGVSGLARRFYICTAWGSCPDDIGWMVINDVNRNIAICNWESQNIPTLLYSTGSGSDRFDQMKPADSMAILIKTRS